MSWKFFVDHRESFVELTVQGSLFVRTFNRRDQMITGLKEALSQLPADISINTAQLLVRSDICDTYWNRRWFPQIAFIGPEGFQNLFQIGNQTRSQLFSLNATKENPMISQDHCFGVTPDSQSELEMVKEKLKLSSIQKIVVGFCNADTEKEKTVAQYFSEHEFEVQMASNYLGDELQRASQAFEVLVRKSVWQDFETELKTLGFQSLERHENNKAMTAFVVEDQISFYGPKGNQTRLLLSPFCPIAVDAHGIPQIRYTPVASEPGPVCFGKGVDLTVFDLLALKHSFEFSDIKRLKIDHQRTKKYLQLLAQQMRTNIESVVDGYLNLFRELVLTELGRTPLNQYEFHGWLAPFIFPQRKFAKVEATLKIGELKHG